MLLLFNFGGYKTSDKTASGVVVNGAVMVRWVRAETFCDRVSVCVWSSELG